MVHYLDTVADMVVLSRASGLLVDEHSGFSRMAAYLGGHVRGGSREACLQPNQGCDTAWLDAVNQDASRRRSLEQQ